MSSTAFNETNRHIFDEATNSLASYFSEVVSESGVPTPEQIKLGLDHIFRPTSDFWTHFTREMVFTALGMSCPDWKQKVSASSAGGLSGFSVYISCELIDRILHDGLAEDFLALPPARRPSGKADVFKWIRSHLSKAGQDMMLDAIKKEGPRAADKVLHFVRLRERALCLQ
ncbi:hypothetical protein [Paraburkholderia caribensis]|uniref:hypothetical protein n=1 Tax=Paraburkholderia caribensis TaxID=75105 RepID=UPI001CAFEDFB|nr:hypothetical protein [Paraburkholderia caribensis]CAG9262706.1 hypothetical protein PCAR4_570137 [Paraburkholderia caribensis]